MGTDILLVSKHNRETENKTDITLAVTYTRQTVQFINPAAQCRCKGVTDTLSLNVKPGIHF